MVPQIETRRHYNKNKTKKRNGKRKANSESYNNNPYIYSTCTERKKDKIKSLIFTYEKDR